MLFSELVRPWYKEVIGFCQKDVVIVLDRSMSMQNYLQSVKAAIIGLLNSLGTNDRVISSFNLNSDYFKISTCVDFSRKSLFCAHHNLRNQAVKNFLCGGFGRVRGCPGCEPLSPSLAFRCYLFNVQSSNDQIYPIHFYLCCTCAHMVARR